MATQPSLYGHLSYLLLFDMESNSVVPFCPHNPPPLLEAAGTSLLWELMMQSPLASCSNDDWALGRQKGALGSECYWDRE